jgi:hypothetical protein
LAPQEADRLGYTLTAAECRRRLAIRGGDLVKLLASEELPSVRVVSRRGPAAYRIAPADLDAFLERVCTPAPLPFDSIREVEAIEILAGRRLKSGATQHGRMRQRLYAAVQRGDVTRYVLFGSRTRYRGREVEAERDRLQAAGVSTRRPASRGALRRARMEADGLVDTSTAAALVGVPSRTAQGWAGRGLYGARKQWGQWWFERQSLPDAPPNRTHEAPAFVACAGCGQVQERPAWEIRNANLRGRRIYCAACWSEVGEEVTHTNLRDGRDRRYQKPVSETTRARMSDAHALRWQDADDHERAQKRDELRGGYDKLLKSPKRKAATAASVLRGRTGREPTLDERRRWEGRALSRAQHGSGRSIATRDQESRLRELWPTRMTVRQIAEELGTSESNIKQMRRRLNLPERPRGRPIKK